MYVTEQLVLLPLSVCPVPSSGGSALGEDLLAGHVRASRAAQGGRGG